MGIAGYYRKFVKNFGVLSKPLTNLLRKGVEFQWTPEVHTFFESLKHALATAPVLALPDFNKTFVIETDASDSGIGAVLSQDKHPIAYVSKALGPRTKGLSTYEKECLAILLAVDHWRSYLQYAEFLILTDHKSLMNLTNQRLHTSWQQKAYTKLLGLKPKIYYKKGNHNGAADALSRCDHGEPLEAAAISICKPTWLEEVAEGYLHDAKSAKLLAQLSIQNLEDSPYKLKDGLIRYKGRIWLGHNSALQNKIFGALHDSSIGGHSGFPVTYRRIKTLFAWPGMKKQIKLKVKECSICQQAKPDRFRYPGLLQPLPVPSGAWQTVTMDFIEGLPKSRRFNCIMVVVDKLSRYAHFLPLAHPFSAADVAELYMEGVFKLHGLPLAVVSDHDKIFTSNFWEQLFQSVGTKLHMSTTYHPQTDGQTERVNQCLETYLRYFTHSCPSKWSTWLYLVEYWYNTTYHSTLEQTPFEVLYGHTPNQLGISVNSCELPNVQQWLSERRLMMQLLQQHLHRAQQYMKTPTDKKRSFRSFAVGDWVYLKLQPYVQSSVAARANHKLSFKYFGPYEVLRKVGEVAYQLALPEGSAVNPVFHVSQLKSAQGFKGVSSPMIPTQMETKKVPVAVLDTRVRKSGTSAIPQVLIQWSDSAV